MKKSGVAFTVILYVIFIISERLNAEKKRKKEKALEQFNLEERPEVVAAKSTARPGCIVIAVRGNNLEHFKRVLHKTNLRRHDIVVMTSHPISTGAAEFDLHDDQIFGHYEQELFSNVVTIAEKEGKPVELVVVPATDPFAAMVQTASDLKASRLVTGVSPKMASEELARRIGLAWEKLPEPRHAFSLEVITLDRPSIFVNLGPHPPRLWPEDVDRLHELWLVLSAEELAGSKLHHRDVVGAALRRLESELEGPRRGELLTELKKELHAQTGPPPA